LAASIGEPDNERVSNAVLETPATATLDGPVGVSAETPPLQAAPLAADSRATAMTEMF
jgi:hypothetical protein